MNYFTFNNTSSAHFGIHIQSKQIYTTPTYAYALVAIPGRDGELVQKQGGYSNVTVSYTCFFRDLSKVRLIRAWLFSSPGEYAVLTDSYDNSYFR